MFPIFIIGLCLAVIILALFCAYYARKLSIVLSKLYSIRAEMYDYTIPQHQCYKTQRIIRHISEAIEELE